jgi:peptide/nickel transport system ATP-binding protein
MSEQPIVAVENLTVDYPVGRLGLWRGPKRFARAVEDLSFQLAEGETLGLVGESGSGKTTAGRAVIRRLEPSAGTIHFRGEDITQTKGEALRRLRRHMQMVFQDPYGSLSPRMSVLAIVAEPLIVHGIVKDRGAAEDRVRELLHLTGLPPDAIHRHPHAFSGGQRQRIGIARALAANPSFVVVDEPVAALDTSIQAQVVNLLQDLQDRLGLTYLFIAHDLSIVRHVSDRVAIMYAGRLMEMADRDAIYDTPRHPYTQSLLSAVPIPDPELQAQRHRIVIPGEVPDPTSPPPGCRFQTRCPYAQPERCADEVPELVSAGTGHTVACHWWKEIAEGSLRPAAAADGVLAPG